MTEIGAIAAELFLVFFKGVAMGLRSSQSDNVISIGAVATIPLR
jgi:hypothetical protein